MAKQQQRRTRPSAGVKKAAKASVQKVSKLPAARPAKAAAAAPPRAPEAPSQRDLAVQVYERGLQALQERNFARAAELLRSVVSSYPEEKELHERARLYLNICERQAGPRPQAPKTVEDRLYAATVEVNRGAYDAALKLLGSLAAEVPENDHVHYMLSVTHALRGDSAQALPHLRQAIELNPDNRQLAREDADLEVLRQDAGFLAILEMPVNRRDRRPAQRLRSAR